MRRQHIDLQVTFPKDARQKPGFFVATDSRGAVVLTGFCLGKADNHRATVAGNASRDPVKPYGDTPTGDYAPAVVVEFGYKHARIGERWIPIEGAGGAALQARTSKDARGMDKKKRTGLGLHGGRGSDRLIPTYGCIRFKDDDFTELCALIGKGSVTVSVDEATT